MKRTGNTRKAVQTSRRSAKTSSTARSTTSLTNLSHLSFSRSFSRASTPSSSTSTTYTPLSSAVRSRTTPFVPTRSPIQTMAKFLSDTAAKAVGSISDVESSSSESDSSAKLFSRSSGGKASDFNIEPSSPFGANFNPFAASSKARSIQVDQSTASRMPRQNELFQVTPKRMDKLMNLLTAARFNKVNWDDFEDLGVIGNPNEPGAYERISKLFKPGPNGDGMVVYDHRDLKMPRLKPGRKPPHGWEVNDKGECVPLMEQQPDIDLADPDLYREKLHDNIVRQVTERVDRPIDDVQKKSLYEVTSTGSHFMYSRDPTKMLGKNMDKVVKDKYLNQYNSDENVDLSFEYANISPFNKHYRFVNDNPQTHAFMDLPRHKLKFRKQTRPIESGAGPSMDNSFMSYAYYKATRGR